jgi:hypothetical protein
VSDLIEEALAEMLVNGPQPTFVRLAEYDPAWPARVAARAVELRAVLGDRARQRDAKRALAGQELLRRSQAPRWSPPCSNGHPGTNRSAR